jgi:hypothetical protein
MGHPTWAASSALGDSGEAYKVEKWSDMAEIRPRELAGNLLLNKSG